MTNWSVSIYMADIYIWRDRSHLLCLMAVIELIWTTNLASCGCQQDVRNRLSNTQTVLSEFYTNIFSGT